MRILASLLFLACVICGCSISRHGGIPANAKTSVSTETLIEKRAEANAAGDNKTAAALAKALSDQNQAEINGEMRWLMAAGVLVLAIGVGLAVYGAVKLGLSAAASGCALIVGALTTTSLLPYMPYFALAAVLLAVGGLIWYLRKHMAALDHVVSVSGVPGVVPKTIESLLERAKQRVSK